MSQIQGSFEPCPSDIPPRRNCLRIPILVFLVIYLPSISIHQRGFRSQIPVSRLSLLHALLIDHSVRIDSYERLTPDKALYKGSFYCDKAPATTLAAVPAFAIVALFLRWAGIPLDSDLGWLLSSWIACAGSVALITGLGGVALFLWLLRWVSERTAFLTAVGVFLGAAPFPYSTLLMSHGMAVGLLAMALLFIDGIRTNPLSWNFAGHHANFCAGCCCGLALASEFTSGIVVLGMIIYSTWTGPKRIVSFGAGLLSTASLIPAYNWICFGNPLVFAYQHEAVFTQMETGFFGIHWPDMSKAIRLLFGPSHGLFTWSPFLLFSFAGYYWHDRAPCRLMLIVYLASLVQIGAIAGYYSNSYGGMIGPRLLAPILPLLALPTALGLSRFPIAGAVSVAISILLTFLATCLDIRLPALLETKPNFADWQTSYNIGSVFGLGNALSALLLLSLMAWAIFRIWRALPEVFDSDTARARLETRRQRF